MPYRTPHLELDYDGPVIRPPLESRSLILQVTVGCSHNRCRYCPAYRMKRFRIKDRETVMRDIQSAAEYGFECVFLADGDALIMPPDRFVEILSALKEAGLGQERVSTYANVKSLKKRKTEDLERYLPLGLKRLYVGLESGSDEVLRFMNKGVTAEETRAHSLKAKRLGYEVSMTMPLGLGGRRWSKEHVEETTALLNEIQPHHVRLLTLMVVPGTELAEDVKTGSFTPIDPWESVEELRALVAGLAFPTKLYANHISNYLPVKGRLPEDREALLKQIDAALKSRESSVLRSDAFRGL